MAPNDKLIQEISESLKTVFAEEARAIRIECEDEHKAHRMNIDKRIWRVLGLAVLIIGSLFGGMFGFIRNNSGDIDKILDAQIEYQIESNRRQMELENDVGIIDGIVSEKFPDSYGLGNAYEKYIKNRGGTVK